jgi:hypothetical protein
MAPVDPTATDRLKIKYEGPFGNHTLLLHAKDGVPTADFIADAIALLNQLAKLLYSTAAFTDALLALAGSDIFNAIPFTVIPSTGPTTPDVNSAPSTFIQFGGRDSAGKRVKLYLFESGFLPRFDMRYQAGENADLDDTVAMLSDETSTIGTIAGGAPVWKSYVNVGQNDYLTHKARR